MAPEAVKRVPRVKVAPAVAISEALHHLDRAGTGALLLCDTEDRLCGLLTDGDVRRAILHGISLDRPCSEIASRSPVVIPPEYTQAEALHLMNERDINHLPVVDPGGRVLGFLLRSDLAREEQLAVSAVIMAGGYGKRLQPLTNHTPKPMLPIGDQPLLDVTLERLRDAGIRRVAITTHHLPDKITTHVGDGGRYGVEVRYMNESDPLGTAGGLKMLKDCNEPVLVINGDILTRVDFRQVYVYHRRHKADLTAGMRRFEYQVQYGVMECEGASIRRVVEKPKLAFLVNAGIYLLEPSVCDYIPSGGRFDMTDLIQALIDAGRPVAGYPIIEYWLDIGRTEEYEKAQRDYKQWRAAAQ
jgi:dTDP-glucose pyrophosphorylase/CBS domain-containing protein